MSEKNKKLSEEVKEDKDMLIENDLDNDDNDEAAVAAAEECAGKECQTDCDSFQVVHHTLNLIVKGRCSVNLSGCKNSNKCRYN